MKTNSETECLDFSPYTKAMKARWLLSGAMAVARYPVCFHEPGMVLADAKELIKLAQAYQDACIKYYAGVK